MRIQWLIILLMVCAMPVMAETDTQAFTLDNGMQVIVKPDHRAPVAVLQVWYKIGSSYEETGATGLSHVLEHMMFKGTQDIGPGEFSRLISELGGSENAFTSRDYTAYFETLSVQHLDRAMQLEADRMRNLLLDQKEFAKEIEVVKEERRLRTEDKPTALTYEQLQAVAWRASPYRNPVIGWMQDLDSMTLADLQDWYERWYAPNNAILVVVGDITAEQVMQKAQKYFAPIAASSFQPPKIPVEPQQRGLTRVTVNAPARQPYIAMGYKVPVVNTAKSSWEPYALYVLSSVLDGGDSARLSSELIRKQQIAASISAQYDGYSRLSSLFLFGGAPTDQHTTADIETALREQIGKLQQDLIGADELNRVINQVIANKVYERDSISHQAVQIGVLASIGLDWRILDEEIERIRAVTPEQVRKVARKYLVDDNLTIASLAPQPMGKAQRLRSAWPLRH